MPRSTSRPIPGLHHVAFRGEALKLPAQYEAQRTRIERILPGIRVPS